MLAPIAWRTPPRHYGPWERVTSLLTEALIAEGVDVTLFATGDSETKGKLAATCPRGYEEDRDVDAKVWECLHIAHCMERAQEFDIIHNQFDFLPLSYSRLIDTPLITTIHGFSSPRIIPVYERYNDRCHYISISNADRSARLRYLRTVYHGIDVDQFTFRAQADEHSYLLYFGRIHPDKGTADAIAIAKEAGIKLVLAGIVQDESYYREVVEPELRPGKCEFVGSADPAQRDALLGGALALLHPIGFAEPFGLSVVEAMACGTPVIAYPKGSMPELISHAKDGFLVSNVAEAVEAVRKVESIDRASCRDTVETRFTVKKMAEGYLEVYRELVK